MRRGTRTNAREQARRVCGCGVALVSMCLATLIHFDLFVLQPCVCDSASQRRRGLVWRWYNRSSERGRRRSVFRRGRSTVNAEPRRELMLRHVQAHPLNAATALRQRAALVDEIWHAAGAAAHGHAARMCNCLLAHVQHVCTHFPTHLLTTGVFMGAGDKSSDTSWYSKRASLAAVYSATELFMITGAVTCTLGDATFGRQLTQWSGQKLLLPLQTRRRSLRTHGHFLTADSRMSSRRARRQASCPRCVCGPKCATVRAYRHTTACVRRRHRLLSAAS